MVADRFVRWTNQAPYPPSEEAQAAIGHGKATAKPFVTCRSNNQGLLWIAGTEATVIDGLWHTMRS